MKESILYLALDFCKAGIFKDGGTVPGTSNLLFRLWYLSSAAIRLGLEVALIVLFDRLFKPLVFGFHGCRADDGRVRCLVHYKE